MEIPHCPHPTCSNFSVKTGQNWFVKFGFHPTKAFGRIRRFRCKSCGRTFSTQTFSIDYYAKKKVNYWLILEQLISASGILDTGRNLNLRAETIQNRIERLARCCLLIHSEVRNLLPMKENLAADGFETFSFSQHFPGHINIFAGSDSEFLYTLGFASLRRKGCMTAEQKAKRTQLEEAGKADPQAVEKSFRALAEDITHRYISKGVTGKILYTDEHHAYPRALKKIPDFSAVFTHKTVSSRLKRTWDNPLFPVNYADRQFRKDLSDHCRQTVQFARCPCAMMSRMVIYQFYHNCVIPRRVKAARKKDYETHAERAGISRELLEEILISRWGKRAFLGKADMGSEEVKTWLLKWRNPGRKMGRYVPQYVHV